MSLMCPTARRRHSLQQATSLAGLCDRRQDLLRGLPLNGATLMYQAFEILGPPDPYDIRVRANPILIWQSYGPHPRL